MMGAPPHITTDHVGVDPRITAHNLPKRTISKNDISLKIDVDYLLLTHR